MVNEMGLTIRDRVYDGDQFSEICEFRKVLEILVNAINPETLTEEERAIFNKFKDNTTKVKELTNGVTD